MAGLIIATFASAVILNAQPKLSIVGLTLHQFEDGPELAPTYEFVPGETVYFSCRGAGFQILKKDVEQRVNLLWHMRAVDPAGLPIVKDESRAMEESLAAQDKDWTPKFSTSFIVPGFAAAGNYKIAVTMQDQIAGTNATAELIFQVRGHAMDSSDKLVDRNFQFLRSEDDKVPMNPAIYHPGDTLWARFDITGYKYGANNRFSVDYGLAILNAAGQELFSQPSAAADSHESFYPQRYIPGALSLNLDPNVPKAAYTLLITIRDKIGGQTFETRRPFQVE
jgi:hypothetical protein